MWSIYNSYNDILILGSLDIRGTAEMIEQGVVTDHADIISSLLTESIVEFSQVRDTIDSIFYNDVIVLILC